MRSWSWVAVMVSIVLSALPFTASEASPGRPPEAVAEVNAKPTVVPALQQWSGGSGRLVLDRRTSIVVAHDDLNALRPVAQQLAEDLREVAGLRPRIATAGKVRAGDIRLEVSPSADVGADTEVARAEGYTLDVDGHGRCARITLQLRAPIAPPRWLGPDSIEYVNAQNPVITGD